MRPAASAPHSGTSNARSTSHTEAIAAIATDPPANNIRRYAHVERSSERERQEHDDDRELPRFDAEVESEQRQRERARRQAEVVQRAGEAEAVQQAEAERRDPASVRDHRMEVVERREHHRQRDAGLDQPRRQHDDATAPRASA